MKNPLANPGAVSVSWLLCALCCSPTQTGWAQQFQPGDLFLGEGNGQIYQYRYTSSVSVLYNQTGPGFYVYGMCFNTKGEYLYATGAVGTTSGRISRFGNTGILLNGIWGPGYSSGRYPLSCVADAMGNLYVGDAVGIGVTGPQVRRLGADGSLLGYLSPATVETGFQGMDLASDQCSLHYMSGGMIKRFDVCTNSQLSDFANAANIGGSNTKCSDLRMRKNGELLVACSARVIRLNTSGQLIRAYEASYYQLDRSQTAPLVAVSLDPDGTSFWAATSQYGLLPGRVIKIDIASGQLKTFFELTTFNSLAVFRAPSAAVTECSDGIDNDLNGLIDYPADPKCSSARDVFERRCFVLWGRTFCLVQIRMPKKWW